MNHFQAAGGMAFVIGQLLDGGLLHGDVHTVAGAGLHRYRQEPFLAADGSLVWRPWTGAKASTPRRCARSPTRSPPTAAVRVLRGQPRPRGDQGVGGRAVASAVTAPARCSMTRRQSQAFASGDWTATSSSSCATRVRGQRDARAAQLAALGVLQDRGHRVALVTDGRMSGASGKVIPRRSTSPGARRWRSPTRVRDGDVIRLDSEGRHTSRRAVGCGVALPCARRAGQRR